MYNNSRCILIKLINTNQTKHALFDYAMSKINKLKCVSNKTRHKM